MGEFEKEDLIWLGVAIKIPRFLTWGFILGNSFNY